jgi:hypothetical protein
MKRTTKQKKTLMRAGGIKPRGSCPRISKQNDRTENRQRKKKRKKKKEKGDGGGWGLC